MPPRPKVQGFHCPRCGGFCGVDDTRPHEDSTAERDRKCYQCGLKFLSREIAYPPPIEDAAKLVLASVKAMENLWTTDQDRNAMRDFMARFPEDVSRLEEIESYLRSFARRFRESREALKQVEAAQV